MWAYLCILPFNHCHLCTVAHALATVQHRCAGPPAYFIFYLRGVACMLLLDPHNFPRPTLANHLGSVHYCTVFCSGYSQLQLVTALHEGTPLSCVVVVLAQCCANHPVVVHTVNYRLVVMHGANHISCAIIWQLPTAQHAIQCHTVPTTL